MGSTNLSIENLSVGIDSTGMESYKEQLKTSLITETIELLGEVTEVTNAIDSCWQGQACDKFKSSLADTISAIGDDLQAEYNDLDARLKDLENMYFAQDINMME